MKWEYKVMPVFHQRRVEIEDDLCRSGLEGWEFVFAMGDDYAVAKRPIAEVAPVSVESPATVEPQREGPPWAPVENKPEPRTKKAKKQ